MTKHQSRRLRQWATGVALVWIAGGGAGRGQDRPAAPSSPATTAPATLPALNDADRAILHRLESGTWQQRKAAEAKLSHWLVADVPRIQAMVAATHSPEAHARLQGVLTHLDYERLAGASIITLHMKDASAKAVYAELFRQAWAPCVAEPANLLDDPRLPRVTVDIDGKPFWAVMEQLTKTTGIWLETQRAGPPRLRKEKVDLVGPQILSGPFLVVLSTEPVLQDEPNGMLDFWTRLYVYAEPKIHVIGIDPDLKLAAAVDDRGNAMQQAITPASIMNNRWNGLVGIAIDMRAAEKNRGDRLVRLQTNLAITIALHIQHVDIPNLQTAPPQLIPLDRSKIKFTGCSKAGDTFAVSFESDPATPLRELAANAGANLRVLDATGKELPTGLTQISSSPLSQGATFTILGGQPAHPHAAPARLIWDIPCDTQTINVPLNFKDISVPFASE